MIKEYCDSCGKEIEDVEGRIKIIRSLHIGPLEEEVACSRDCAIEILKKEE